MNGKTKTTNCAGQCWCECLQRMTDPAMCGGCTRDNEEAPYEVADEE